MKFTTSSSVCLFAIAITSCTSSFGGPFNLLVSGQGGGFDFEEDNFTSGASSLSQSGSGSANLLPNFTSTYMASASASGSIGSMPGVRIPWNFLGLHARAYAYSSGPAGGTFDPFAHGHAQAVWQP